MRARVPVGPTGRVARTGSRSRRTRGSPARRSPRPHRPWPGPTGRRRSDSRAGPRRRRGRVQDPRSGVTGQVPDEVDRARREGDAVLARRRAGRLERPARVGDRARRRAAELARERLERGRRQRPRVAVAGEDDLGARAAGARGASPRRPCRRGSTRPPRGGRPASSARQRLGQRGHPARVVGAVDDRRRRPPDDLEAAGDGHRRGRRGDGGLVERPEEGLGRAAGQREVPALEGARGVQRDARRRPAPRRAARRARP